MKTRSRHSIRGLTLIEVCFLVVILLVAAALVLPLFSRPRSGRHISCVNNLKQIGLGLKLYSSDYQDKYPDDTDPALGSGGGKVLGLLYPDYISARKSFVCPASNDPMPGVVEVSRQPDLFIHPHEGSYAYIDGLDESYPPDSPLVADRYAWRDRTDLKQANHGREGINVLHNDGHVEWIAGTQPLHKIPTYHLGPDETQPRFTQTTDPADPR